jgi:WD40 repeat protein
MFDHRSLSLYGGHDDEINCLVFSHDLEILLTASINGSIRLWNTVFDHLTFKVEEKAGIVKNKKKIKKKKNFFTLGLIRALAISNDDRYFASTANDTLVRLYETRTGCLLYKLAGREYQLMELINHIFVFRTYTFI